MFRNFDLGVFLLAVLPVLLALTVREVVRGYTARRWGDHTAEQYGRLTLNPLPHIDPIGTVLVPLFCLMLSAPFLFGWARPIPSTRAISATRAAHGAGSPYRDRWPTC